MLEKGYKITREQTQRMIFTGLAVLLLYLEFCSLRCPWNGENVFLELVTKRRSFLPSGLLLTGLAAIMFLLNFISKGSVWREFFSVGNRIL